MQPTAFTLTPCPCPPPPSSDGDGKGYTDWQKWAMRRIDALEKEQRELRIYVLGLATGAGVAPPPETGGIRGAASLEARLRNVSPDQSFADWVNGIRVSRVDMDDMVYNGGGLYAFVDRVLAASLESIYERSRDADGVSSIAPLVGSKTVRSMYVSHHIGNNPGNALEWTTIARSDYIRLIHTMLFKGVDVLDKWRDEELAAGRDPQTVYGRVLNKLVSIQYDESASDFQSLCRTIRSRVVRYVPKFDLEMAAVSRRVEEEPGTP